MCSIHLLGCQSAMNRRVLLYPNEHEPWHLHGVEESHSLKVMCVIPEMSRRGKATKTECRLGLSETAGKAMISHPGRCESR